VNEKTQPEPVLTKHVACWRVRTVDADGAIVDRDFATYAEAHAFADRALAAARTVRAQKKGGA